MAIIVTYVKEPRNYFKYCVFAVITIAIVGLTCYYCATK